MNTRLTHIFAKSPEAPLLRFCIAVIFSIALAYIESAVVVYLREIFYPAGFTFPLPEFGVENSVLWGRLLVTEIGRETASMVLIFSAAVLFGSNLRRRFAFFLLIFSIWDIFYYIWLKVLLSWPGSVMDWDVLFLIPVPWACPVLAPLLVSAVMLCFSCIIFYRDHIGKPVKTSAWDWLGYITAALIIIMSFCIAGRHITKADYAAHFCRPVFLAALAGTVAIFIKALIKSQ